jgi:hypothetical protein
LIKGRRSLGKFKRSSCRKSTPYDFWNKV